MKLSPYIADALHDIKNMEASEFEKIKTFQENLAQLFTKLENRPGTFLFPTTIGQVNGIRDDIYSIFEDIIPYCEKMNQDLQQLEAKRKDLQQRIKDVSRQIHDLEKETKVLNQDLASITQSISDQMNTHSELDEKLKKTNFFGKMFQKKQLEQYKQKLELASKEIEDNTNKKTSIQTQITEKNSAVENIKSQKNTLSSNMDNLSTKISETEAERDTQLDDKKRDLKHLFKHVNMLIDKNDRQLDTNKPKIILAKNIRR